MIVDIISVIVRALSFIALFQATGVAIMIAVFGGQLEQSSDRFRRIGFICAIAGALLIIAYYALEAGRMAGEMSGVFDLSLQRLALDSPLSRAVGLRVLGLILIATTVRRHDRTELMGLMGALAVVVSFTLVGHTTEESGSVWDSLALILHLALVAFWFGGLALLHLASRLESPPRAAQIVMTFSRIATVLVPCLFLMGVALTLFLVHDWEIFTEPYGQLLIAKSAGFALLMVLASLNKWRYGPLLASSTSAARAFRSVVAAEYLLICAVFTVTAVMTGFFSPSG